MNIDEFKILKQHASKYKYNSFEYLKYENVKEYCVMQPDGGNIIAIRGYDSETGMEEIYWASDSAEALIKAVRSSCNAALVTFIPPEWKATLEKCGFQEYGVLREYWINDIYGLQLDAFGGYRFLCDEDCAAAADVTMKCRWQSREFHGESEDWFRQWMRGADPNAAECRNCRVLVHKEGLKTAGIACVATYAHESHDGAVVWIRELAVAPEYQGRGIGKKLLLQSLKYGMDNGAKRAFLMADDLNDTAKALYTKVGFAPSAVDVQIDLIYRRTNEI